MRTRAPYLPDRRGSVPTVMRPPATGAVRSVPRALPVKLQSLMHIHLRVTSRRWKSQRASLDGTEHHYPDGPVMRARTELLTPVPPLERTPRQ
jgi:hypothetical protein